MIWTMPFRTISPGSGSDRARIAWIDTAKGLCIILVVMMHATLGLGEAVGREGWLHEVVAFARPFRMPDFFLVSGLFLARVIDRDWRAYADRRIVHFLYFYGLWTAIQLLLKAPQLTGGEPLALAHHFALALVEPFGTLWFVYLLAVFSAVTKLLHRVPGPLLLAVAAALEIAPIHTGWTLIDEFAERWVYFLGGYLLAPHLFAVAAGAAARPLPALLGLAAWAIVNGALALTPTGFALFPTLASLPVVSLVLGAAGAVAIVTAASLLTAASLARPLQYCGRKSIAIYLAFFLPAAATRAALVKLDHVGDVGWAALVVTLVGIVAPLALERAVRHTPLAALFVRPSWFRLGSTRRREAAPRLETWGRTA